MLRFTLTALLLACSSAPPPSPGVDPPTVAASKCAPRDLNAYGVCYPTGDGVIPNDCSGSFCFAQLYDPEHRFAARLIHLAGLASWCMPCRDEMDFITGNNTTGANTAGVSYATELAPQVVFIEVLVDGPVVGSGATQNDLNDWLQSYPGSTTIIDPNLGLYFDSAAVPLNMDIDTRTMRIIQSEVGFDTNLDQSLKAVLASL